MVKFISYDGKYPTLCSGTLVLEIDGSTVAFESPLWLQSGGGTNWKEGEVWSGPWEVLDFLLPEEYKDYAEEILQVINENVEFGCCGGCL